jgi:hydrogenase/urease accessory protein HupE
MSLLAGLLHPLTLPAHVLALVALALLIGAQRAWLSLAAFALGLAGGLAAIALGTGETPALDILLAATALAGGLVALAQPLPAAGTAGIAAIAGATLGLDSPPEAISIAAATAMLIGTGIGACLALILIAIFANLLAREWQRIGLRIIGSWMAASAILVLALRFARGLMFG